MTKTLIKRLLRKKRNGKSLTYSESMQIQFAWMQNFTTKDYFYTPCLSENQMLRDISA